MGLLDRKKTEFFDAQPYYTIGGGKTMLFIGLGNPGKEYAANRHNVGFMAIDRYHMSHDFSDWTLKKDLQVMIASAQIGSSKIILAKPTTFMNKSGDAVQKLQKFFQIYNNGTVVVHDEIDVEFGTIRTRIGGGNAGHNGIKSIAEQLGEDFGRVRIGIGPKKPEQMDSADFVLQDFSKKEQELIPKILQETSSILDEASVGELPEHTLKVD